MLEFGLVLLCKSEWNVLELLTGDKPARTQYAYAFMMHFSLTINSEDPNIFLMIKPEIFKTVEGCEWNDFDVQTLHVSWSFPLKEWALTLSMILQLDLTFEWDFASWDRWSRCVSDLVLVCLYQQPRVDISWCDTCLSWIGEKINV